MSMTVVDFHATFLRVLVLFSVHVHGIGLHKVPEGHLGVYFRGGALLDRVTGRRLSSRSTMLCSGGTIIAFDKVEVVNQLHASAAHAIVKNYTVHYDRTWIYDKIHHEINQFCSQHTLQEVYIDKFDRLDEILKDTLQRDIDVFAAGLMIIAIRVTKPRIPLDILRNYEKIEAEKTALKVAEQTQKLVEKKAETDRKKAIIEADKEAMVAAIHLNQTLAAKRNEQRIAQIENDMRLAKIHAEADAELYRAMKEAEANRVRLTPELLHLETVRALANNTKIYFGDSIPKLFVGSDLADLSRAAVS